ncbi:peroxiredoxin [Bordetella trematum]|uniref:thioredoxin-dependent peroxiredoxin n=1 Tax=Bordetella trematum TaxID=123899 RepID=A0A157JXI7_9BORD|nr:peroxiredoxin [Bordetella trematum]AZR94154.1 peroxiredoxin [Bordetella trematum]NNH20490.1 peroxiredoxin [Bordetella trematum]SAH77031.1 bacterioferritin comigratory protein [Bordetella trematum]SAI72689.1 bacterioferritin comigratory protein [Bordetella trematum]SUV97664.1 bacterioferritin comigratory protein [Bordetella trematum]
MARPAPRSAAVFRLMAASLLAAGLGAAQAALPLQAEAPAFSAPAALDGATFTFELGPALAQGPVVLYFYPAAFTQGCSLEARSFAQAMDDFQALGATVVGVSTDTLETLQRFSASDCQGRFAVAADGDGRIMRAYDAVSPRRVDYAARTSYVISPQGRILHHHTDPNPEAHARLALQALRKWRAEGGAPPAP